MRHIIEYMGRDGLKTTDLEMIHSRWSTPREGDVVDFSLMKGEYPFTQGQYGTISAIGREFCDKDELMMCCHMGSIYLSWDDKDKTPCVNVSGGPFHSAKINRLKPAYALRIQRMWNFGNNGAVAGGAVYYNIERPIFILQP